MGISAYMNASSSTQEQIIRSNETLLEQVSIRFDQSLSAADSFSLTLSSTQSINDFMLAPLRQELSREDLIYSIWNQFRSPVIFRDSSQLINNYYLYNEPGDFVVGPYQGSLDPEQQYYQFFTYGDYSVKAWTEMLLFDAQSLLMPQAKAQFFDISGEYLLYLRHYFYNRTPIGTFVFYIDSSVLRQDLQALFDSGSTMVYFEDSDGNLLAYYDDQGQILSDLPEGTVIENSNIDGRKTLTTSASFSNGNIVTVIPRAVIAGNTATVLKPILLGLVAILLVGIVLAFTIIYLNNRPLVDTLRTLTPSYTSPRLFPNIIKEINQAATQIADTNYALTQTLDSQRDLLQSCVFNQLISGDFFDYRETDILLEHISMPVDHTFFRGVYILLSADETAENEDVNSEMLERSVYKRTIILELLRPYGEHIHFLTLESPYMMAFLYSYDRSDEEEMRAFFSRLYLAVQEEKHFSCTILVGLECTTLSTVSYSFRSARQLASSNNENWLRIASQSASQTCYDFSMADEQYLLTYTSAGDDDLVLERLRTIYERNQMLSLPFVWRNLLKNRMYVVLLKTGFNAKENENLFFHSDKVDLEEYFNLISQCFLKQCNTANEAAMTRSQEIDQEIVQYIQDNCCQYETTLTVVSLHFGMIEKNISHRIKAVTGQSFSVYLENLRISPRQSTFSRNGKNN